MDYKNAIPVATVPVLLHVISEENLNHIISDFLQIKQNFTACKYIFQTSLLNDLIYLIALTLNVLMLHIFKRQ